MGDSFARPKDMLDATAVYRFYDYDGVLLYVGISSVPQVRFRQHALNSQWWPLADQSRTRVVWRSFRGLAEAEEVCAIIVERPVWNIRDKPGRVYNTPPPPPTEVLGLRALQLKDVRAGLRSVVEDAAAGSPTVVLKHGQPRAAFVSVDHAEEIARIIGREAEFAAAMAAAD